MFIYVTLNSGTNSYFWLQVEHFPHGYESSVLAPYAVYWPIMGNYIRSKPLLFEIYDEQLFPVFLTTMKTHSSP